VDTLTKCETGKARAKRAEQEQEWKDAKAMLIAELQARLAGRVEAYAAREVAS
jgi:hypothetical protein